MKIFNTFSGKKEKINLGERIGIYVCGITPDAPAHLGHAFLFVTYDTLIRYLRFLGAKVTYVQNVTDIDDDILIRSKKAGLSWEEMGNIQTKNYIKNMDALNVVRPDFYPKATENVGQMITIIKKLVAKKLAYTKNGSVLGPQSERRGPQSSVYFSVLKDKNFGKLSKYDYPAMLEIANERGNFPEDPIKNNPLDFVLWQAKKEGEPSWPSPWGNGRPGWHIECSVMSMRYLGPTITIHGGGSDLIFPHHEAEIAQSQNVTGKKFVKAWMHTAMVFCEGKKMSKSLGNMIFISDLIKKYSPNTIRILLLSHHYRNPWNFDEAELEKAEKIIATFKQALKGQALALAQHGKRPDLKYAQKYLPAFFKSLDDDFNTPAAIKVLEKAAKSKKPETKAAVILAASQIFGLNLS